MRGSWPSVNLPSVGITTMFAEINDQDEKKIFDDWTDYRAGDAVNFTELRRAPRYFTMETFPEQ